MFGAGELFFFGYSVKKTPHVTYKVADPSGHIRNSVAITIPRAIMMHDFAITQDYAIFLDCPMVFRPEVSSLAFCLCKCCIPAEQLLLDIEPHL